VAWLAEHAAAPPPRLLLGGMRGVGFCREGARCVLREGLRGGEPATARQLWCCVPHLVLVAAALQGTGIGIPCFNSCSHAFKPARLM